MNYSKSYSTKKINQTILTTVLCVGCLFLFPPKIIYADGISLSISPSVLRIQAKPPADVWTPFIIENQSNHAVTLKIGYKAFDPQASSNGNVVFVKDGQDIPGIDKKIFDKMQVVDDQNISNDTIELGPKQKERLRLRILLPLGEPVSDYYFSLIFLQITPQIDQNITNNNIEDQKSSSTIQAGIGTNVLLAVGDKEAPAGSIVTFSAPSFSNQGPIPFSLSIHNEGQHFITPKGFIMIRNMFGQTVGKVVVPESIILAGTSRNFVNNSSLNSASVATLLQQSNHIINGINWPEKVLFGMYTATITLSLSDQGPVFIRSVQFFVFPFMFLVECLAILGIFFYIYLRVKRKIS